MNTFTYKEIKNKKTFLSRVRDSLMQNTGPVTINVDILKDGWKVSCVKNWTIGQVEYIIKMLNKHSNHNSFILEEEEYINYNSFKKTHMCDSKNREIMMEEECAPTYTEVIMRESTIGINIFAKCHVCGQEKCIMSRNRINSI